MKPRGRRPGSSTTREAILDAARTRFAEGGYDRATIRDVARQADVDPALVMYFFPTKSELFAAAMELPFDAEAAVAAVLAGDRGRIGDGMARLFFTIWDGPGTGARMVGMLRAATSYEGAAQRFRDLLDAGVIRPLARAIDTPDATLRASLVSSQLLGIGLTRYVLRMEPVASAAADDLVAALAPTLQRYVVGDLTSATLDRGEPLFNNG
jgi:AcrR family transcriptional regulator